jgi:hypothetical protein
MIATSSGERDARDDGHRGEGDVHAAKSAGDGRRYGL